MNRVLIIAYNDLNNSGVPNVIYQTIKALHHNYIFDVFVFGDDEYYYQKLKKEGIKISLIKFIDKKPQGKLKRLFWWFFKNPREHYNFMMDVLRQNDYAVIHSFKEYYSWPFFKAAKKMGIQNRILHRNINPAKPNEPIIRILESKNKRLSLKFATNRVGVSKSSCDVAFGKKKYTILHNSYNEDKYNMRVKSQLSTDELVITEVASYSENKNQLFALSVLKELKKLHKNTRLNLVGATEVTPYYQELIDYVKNNDLDNDVSFIERTDNVNKIYEKTTFVIIPSFREGFSLVAIEAQACGINVFASSSVPGEVNCGGVSFLDLSKGSKYWAKEIYKLFIKLGNKRTQYNMDEFSFEKFKMNLLTIYNS